jgi:hypothetical protein
LVEGTPDEDMEDVIEFDPTRKIGLQTVIVRLMTNSRYPLTYNDEFETKTREKFTQAFRGIASKFITAIQKESSYITFNVFNRIIH